MISTNECSRIAKIGKGSILFINSCNNVLMREFLFIFINKIIKS